jgi:glycosyltransferase involved in cell wall biosynthesis
VSRVTANAAPTLSVVIPTRDKAPLLRRTLAGLAAQDLDPRAFEVVVVDDGSSDDTPSDLAAVHTPFALHAVRLEANRGRAAARNRGLARAGAPLVVFLDDDMEVEPGFLRAHRAFHEGRTRVAAVGNVRNHPEIVVAPVDRYMSTRGAQKIRTRGPIPWKYFSTNNASVQKEDLDAIGGFDEAFVTYGFEDLELALRLETERGVTIGFVEDARSLHLHAHSLDELLEKKRVAGASSLPHLFRKHPETRRALRFERFDPPRGGDPAALNAARAFYACLFTRPVYAALRPLARLPLGPIANRALDYLVQYHTLLGLRAARGPAADRTS